MSFFDWFRRPDPPKNVHVIRWSGEVIPLDCVYGGYNRRDQLHQWWALVPALGLDFDAGDRLCVDELPGHTRISVRVQGLVD